jgi:FdhD protein
MKGAYVDEIPVTVSVNGQAVLQGTCSPDSLEAFAVGRLLSEGYIVDRDDVHAVAIHGGELARNVMLELPLPAAQAGEAERRHRTQHGCGLLYYLECSPETIRRPWTAEAPDLAIFPALYQHLFAAAETHRDTGGMHSAALSDGNSLFHVVHDVGRHNAVDKSIGQAILADSDLHNLGLLLSSRISGEIALKAARAGITWVASRSIPTSLALRVARVANLPLIGRAPGKDAFVHEPIPPSVA